MSLKIKCECKFCGKKFQNSGITRHLNSCKERLKVIEKSNSGKRKSEDIFHLRIQDKYVKEYSLNLEMRGSSRLSDLDHYLRVIWLDCCGHLSMFTTGGWTGEELNMEKMVKNIFVPGRELTHIYDYGTSSETIIKVIDSRIGKALTKHPINLMARNKDIPFECHECGKPATHFCGICLYEGEEDVFVCEEHLNLHEHEDYLDDGVSKIPNSPRLGYCAYEGPSDSPY